MTTDVIIATGFCFTMTTVAIVACFRIFYGRITANPMDIQGDLFNCFLCKTDHRMICGRIVEQAEVATGRSNLISGSFCLRKTRFMVFSSWVYWSYQGDGLIVRYRVARGSLAAIIIENHYHRLLKSHKRTVPTGLYKKKRK